MDWDILLEYLPRVLLEIVKEYDSRYPQEAWQICQNVYRTCYGTYTLTTPTSKHWTFQVQGHVRFIGISTSLEDVKSCCTRGYANEVSMNSSLNSFFHTSTDNELFYLKPLQQGDYVHLWLDLTEPFDGRLYVAKNDEPFHLVQRYILSTLSYYPFCLTDPKPAAIPIDM